MRALIENSRRFVIISPGYNCEKFIDLWWNSLLVQSYENWICIAINDMSTDGTLSRLSQLSQLDERLIVVNNIQKKYQAKNWYDTIHNERHLDECLPHKDYTINDDDIIIFIDMDDWFGTKYALELTLKEYLTYPIEVTTAPNFSLSDYKSHDGKIFTDRDDIVKSDKHEYSLFSYTARLFRRIPEDYFKYCGYFLEVCGDYLITSALLYLAGPEHYRHQSEPQMIIYNNIRLENDQNKKDDKGVKLHDLAKVFIKDNFNKYILDKV